MTSRDDKILLSLAEAAEAVGHSVSTMRRAVRTSDPASFPPPLRAKRGAKGAYFVLPKDLDRWAESLPDA